MFALLGVIPYLTLQGFRSTLEVVGGHPASTQLVLDYGLPREALPLPEQQAFDSLAQRVAQAGEPFQLFFTEAKLGDELDRVGLPVQAQLSPHAMNERFFRSRGSNLRVLGSGARLALAVR